MLLFYKKMWKGGSSLATKLKNLRVKKVDFVDAGANPDADIKLFKRNDPDVPSAKSRKSHGVVRTLLDAIGKAMGLKQEEIEDAIEEIKKDGCENFGEKLNEIKTQKIADEIWNICFALQYALCSAVCDYETDSTETDSTETAAAMEESLKEFLSVMQDCIPRWSEGKEADIVRKSEDMTETELDFMKAAVERLNDAIGRDAGVEGHKNRELKGDEKEMAIDKSKLTDAERAFYESLEKRYGMDGDVSTSVPALPQEVTDSSSITKAEGGTTMEEPGKAAGVDSDIYKGLHPAVQAELEELKKFRASVEEKELTEVAKKYAIIGKKPEELVPLFKSLKAAGGTAYNDMIAVLDQTVETVEKSGAFSEIGKSGHGSNENSAEVKVGLIAKKLLEENPTMSLQQAVAKAWEDNPELLAEYDNQAGF